MEVTVGRLLSHGAAVTFQRSPPPDRHLPTQCSTSNQHFAHSVLRRPSLRSQWRLKSLSSQEDKSSEYNRRMKQQMGWEHVSPYEYHYDRGLYYHEIDTNLYCGTQPRNVADVDHLHKVEGITHIVNMQQDRDLHEWGVDFHSLWLQSKKHDMRIIRRPAVDFDPHSLRKTLPFAVSAVEDGLANQGKVYVHCTAGLGRAPAVCIAYLYWFKELTLDQAYKHLTDIRPCGPRRESIRGATYDLLAGGDFDGFDRLGHDAYASLNVEDRLMLQYKIASLPL